MGLRDWLWERIGSEQARMWFNNFLVIMPVFLMLAVLPRLPPQYANIAFIAFFPFYFGGLFAYQKWQQAEAAKYLAFRDAHWWHGETVKDSMDILVEGIVYLDDQFEDLADEELEEIHAYRQAVKEIIDELGTPPEPGSMKWHPYLVEFRYPVKVPGLGENVRRAIWLLPDLWEETFHFDPDKDVWFGPVVVSHPQVENVVLVTPVGGFVEWFDETIPVAYVTWSSWHMRKFANGGSSSARVEVPSLVEMLRAKIRFMAQHIVHISGRLKQLQEYMKGTDMIRASFEELCQKRLDEIVQLRNGFKKPSVARRFVSGMVRKWWLWLLVGLMLLWLMQRYGYVEVRY